MKKTLILLSVMMASLSLWSCSGSENIRTEGQEAATPSELTEEQRQAAAKQGWAAARELINATDTLEMQTKLLEARAKQSEYVTQKRAAEAEVFDTAFVHTLRAVRPDIYNELHKPQGNGY